MSDPQEDAKRVAKILRNGDYDYDGSKYLFKLARRRAGLKPPENRTNTVDRMSQEETDRFIDAAYSADGRRGLMLRTLLETMLRVSEFVSLQVEDVSFAENLVVVRDGKGGKRREVPITESLNRELNLHVGGRNTGPLFQSPRGGTYSARRIQQIVKETAKEAGIEKRVYPHLLRHTMATRLVNSGMPIEHVRKVLGHELIDKTRVYAETAVQSVQESFEKARSSS
ncbi:integrase/recombinase XerD [Salinibacter ruber]|uniref:tyrosine-type recombinase/integrase n=1 Tax=Salinibacter ruber TaxID=146919 RepID=UPI00216A5003|nr:tyrosine-type recombinase/integrase [Salinibacter ruber]MCS3955557.1 integrase/recombinase XerD [Salinibacter ruber]